MNDQRLDVRKTYKLCIGGSESGRVTPALTASGRTLESFSRASRKALRDVVSAARLAFDGWARRSAILRAGQAQNLKRFAARSLTTAEWFSAKAEDPYWILDTVEFKTTWHPIGV